MLIVVAIAAIVALFATTILIQSADNMLADFYSGYSEKVTERNESYIDKLQNYIDRRDLKSTDVKQIRKWADRHPEIIVSIYRSNATIYDSSLPDNPTSVEETLNTMMGTTYKVKFSDTSAFAIVYGAKDYQPFSLVEIGIVVIAFALFLLVIFIAINQEVRYIRRLRDEVGILQTGKLDYEITVKGDDELAELARGLNGMRVSLRDQMQVEQNLLKANKRMVTGMSHDIRTPLTSILLYTEILKSHRWQTEDQLYDYINRIDQKTHRLKDLTDHLFEYSLVDGYDQGVTLCEPEPAKVLFYDILSEVSATLTQHGFQCEPDFRWDHSVIRINEDYVARIMDNIVSNIVKYADPEVPILIRVETAGSQVILRFRNKKSGEEHPTTASTGIGLQNIANMMQQMNGTSSVKDEKDEFTIALSFPLDGTVL